MEIISVMLLLIIIVHPNNSLEWLLNLYSIIIITKTANKVSLTAKNNSSLLNNNCSNSKGDWLIVIIITISSLILLGRVPA